MTREQELLEQLETERAARLEAEKKLEVVIESKASELSSSAMRLSYLIANMLEGVLVEDENRKIILVNQEFCTMFAIPVLPDLLVGADCTESAEQSKHFFSDPESFVRGIEIILKNRVKVIGDILLLLDGRTFSRDYVPIIIDSAYRGHFWKYSDITVQQKYEDALIRSEEKYRLLIENMNLGLLEVDLKGKIRYANQSFCIMSGFEREEIYGKIAENIFTEAKNRKLVRNKTESRNKGMVDAYELEITNKQGLKKWWMISGAALHDKDGNQIGSTGIHLDITEQKQLEFTLRHAKQLAENTAKAKEIFLANMSHEIRTPMNAILGLGKLVLNTDLTTYQRSFLESINTAAENLLIVINDILDFSKIESGKLSLESISFNMPKLLNQICKMLVLQTEEKGLQFNVHIDTKISPVLVGDPYRINQILLNLLSNSIKFTEKGSISVDCRLVESNDLNQCLEITVTDTGTGIEKEYQKKIFEKFSQENVSVARKYGGTGLGVAITKQLIDLMDGKITIESEKNVGTKVTILITLPIGLLSEESVDGKENNFMKNLKAKRILLVDDNKINRLIAKTILSKEGIIVTEAGNGEIAIEMLRTLSFDLVLMDIQMPVMDGLTATKLIRSEINESIPVIALTAHALKSEMDNCFEAGMNDFLSKPFEAEKLIAMIAKYIC